MINIIGIDEVGRGCWAGPLLVVAARQKIALLEGLKDSKLLTRAQRESLFDYLRQTCEFGEGWVEPQEIDQFGLADAMRLAVKRALKCLKVEKNQEIIFDGKINYCPDEYANVQAIVKADNVYQIVSAASIYAKVTRDKYMVQIATKYPKYGFENHVGYGTLSHADALKLYGICDIHRKSFKPVNNYI